MAGKIVLKRDGTDHCSQCGINLNKKETIMPYSSDGKIYCKKCYYEIFGNYTKKGIKN